MTRLDSARVLSNSKQFPVILNSQYENFSVCAVYIQWSCDEAIKLFRFGPQQYVKTGAHNCITFAVSKFSLVPPPLWTTWSSTTFNDSVYHVRCAFQSIASLPLSSLLSISSSFFDGQWENYHEIDRQFTVRALVAHRTLYDFLLAQRVYSRT